MCSHTQQQSQKITKLEVLIYTQSTCRDKKKKDAIGFVLCVSCVWVLGPWPTQSQDLGHLSSAGDVLSHGVGLKYLALNQILHGYSHK